MPMAYGGNEQVNPQLDSASAVISKINGFMALGNRYYTVGIATSAVCDAAGALWTAAANVPAGTERVYLAPIEKPARKVGTKTIKRGYQANYQQRNAGTAWDAVTSMNFHVSSLNKP
jgi:hypothetical protein